MVTGDEVGTGVGAEDEGGNEGSAVGTEVLGCNDGVDVDTVAGADVDSSCIEGDKVVLKASNPKHFTGHSLRVATLAHALSGKNSQIVLSDFVGDVDGVLVGRLVGVGDGIDDDGAMVTDVIGDEVGIGVGVGVGTCDGACEGAGVGLDDVGD